MFLPLNHHYAYTIRLVQCIGLIVVGLQALFLETLKTGYAADDIEARDEHSYHTRQRSGESGLRRALDTTDEYAAFFDTTYMSNNIEFGYTGPYELQLDDIAVPLRLGYGDQFVDTA